MKTMNVNINGLASDGLGLPSGWKNSLDKIEEELNSFLKPTNQMAEVYLNTSRAAKKSSIRIELCPEESFAISEILKNDNFKNVFEKHLRWISGSKKIRIILKFEKWRDVTPQSEFQSADHKMD